MRRILSCLCLLSGLGTVAWGVPPPDPRMTAAGPRVEGLTIDGVLDETAWALVSWQSDFTVVGHRGDSRRVHQPAPVQTRFRILQDDYAVYVGVVCDEPNLEALKAQTPWHDGAVWQDDCIELFFDPANDGRYYHQVMVNSRGTIYDSYSADYGLVHSKLWNGAFEAAGHVDREQNRWSVEVKIPFGAIVLGETAGATWKWNVTRERHAGGVLELTTWSPMTDSFHQPRLFGTLTGVSADFAPFRFDLSEPSVDVSRAASGTSTLSMGLTVANQTGRDRRCRLEAAVFDSVDAPVSTAPLLLAAGKPVTVSLPSLSTRGSTAQTDLVFTLRDAETQRILRAVVRKVASEYRPVTVTMLQPCYRDSIYATESFGELLFTVGLSAETRDGAELVRCSLTDRAGGVVARCDSPVRMLSAPISMPIPAISAGEYQLAVRVIGENGTERTMAERTIHKLAPPLNGNEVRVDEHRRVLINGKPFLGIGWYGSVPTNDPRADVVALQNVQTPAVVKVPDATPLREAFEKHGIYTVVSVENGRLYHSFNLWQQGKREVGKTIQEEIHKAATPGPELRDLVRQLVECVRGEPGLLGYYIADEPEIHDIPSSYLENFYRYLCELDPYHPVFVTNDTIDGIVTHGYKCADIIDPDPYSPAWDYVPNFLKKINEVAGPGKATWLTPWHSSGQAHFMADYGTVPPYSFDVLRNQYFVSICYGATGFTAYTSAFFMPEIEHRFGLPHIWRELRFLEEAILAAPPVAPVTVEGAGRIAPWARESGGYVYLAAVNHSSESVEADITWSPLGEGRRLAVLSEGRSVTTTSGKIHDSFAEGAVHIYTDNPAAGRLPVLTAIHRELADRKAAAIKPGNLLHWTRGTTIRCAQGYFAPWFHQYYYYALNGLTDDIGWHAYAWDRKETWMEVTLKQVADVGRVVLYTSNLRDYTLDMIAPDGQKLRATVKGNEESVVEHSFQSPVSCLKLRVTVTAVHSGPDVKPTGPLVAEIEAYEESGKTPPTELIPLASDRVLVAPLLPIQTVAGNALWAEDFSGFESAPTYYWNGKDTKWVLNPGDLHVEPLADARLRIASISSKGYTNMSHIFPYDSAYRFLQVKLDGVEGKGYRFTHIGFGQPSGAKGYKAAINTARPGIYTIDTHDIHNAYRSGKNTTCFVTVGAAGTRKNEAGGVIPGPAFTFDFLRLVRRPLDGLMVTRADGAPLGDSLKHGDTLHFELVLADSAQDAVVEALIDHRYAPFNINGQPYLQLSKGDDDGHVWLGEVTLGEGTGTFTPKGYPVLFRASIAGGKLRESYAAAFVAFE